MRFGVFFTWNISEFADRDYKLQNTYAEERDEDKVGVKFVLGSSSLELGGNGRLLKHYIATMLNVITPICSLATSN